MNIRRSISLAVIFVAAVSAVMAQAPSSSAWAALARNRYRFDPDIVYLTANNYQVRLDVYSRAGTVAQPTLIWIHGGGWVRGAKEREFPSLIPWIEMGWNVVNVEYRLGQVSLGPAAVEDCLCALKWVGANTKRYNFDLRRLVVSGESAGGHLALTTGMIPEGAGLDRECPGAALPKVAAIVDWFGITDVNELIDGPNQRPYAVSWLGSLPDRAEIAKRVSPLRYVRPGLPPTLIIHGDADTWVPYMQSVRLHEALDKADVPNRLITIPGGKHGGFTPDERMRAFAAIERFLSENKLKAGD